MLRFLGKRKYISELNQTDKSWKICTKWRWLSLENCMTNNVMYIFEVMTLNILEWKNVEEGAWRVDENEVILTEALFSLVSEYFIFNQGKRKMC